MHYHIETIRHKLKSSKQDAINHDCISAIVFMAFYIEALLNYIGSKTLNEQWDDRLPYKRKILILSKHLQFNYDSRVEPFQTLEHLKTARNNLAHGKPIAFETTTPSRQDLKSKMQPSWMHLADSENTIHAFENVNIFKSLLFDSAGLNHVTALTSAVGGG